MAKVSKEGLNLIKKFEGLRLNAYLDSAGIPTIGFGSTYVDGVRVKLGMTITEEKALELLEEHIDREVIPYIINLVKVPLKQNQIDALCSLIYNIGGAAFKSSTLLKKINETSISSNFNDIEIAWKMWNKAGGKILQGLVNRRLAEINLYKK